MGLARANSGTLNFHSEAQHLEIGDKKRLFISMMIIPGVIHKDQDFSQFHAIMVLSIFTGFEG